MSRLRVRVELNRGGVGVPLHKLTSVVQEAEKFFEMLAEDVRIETTSGEWLAFDFDNESLNFTAEFIGPVSPEQVQAFAAAFDGTTPLRRATIAQFTRITNAIGQDELVGFGLYHSDQEPEPSEWRCLSRRDALRISDEMHLLMDASGEQDGETLLPAVIDHETAARLFRDRHDRGPAGIDYSKMPELVREMEANLSKRIARLEGQVEEHAESIDELKEISGATEHSFRNLLASVETFCAQATRQLERMTPPAQIQPQLPAPEPARAPIPAPAPVTMTQPATITGAEARPQRSGRGWLAYAIAAIVIIGLVSAVVLVWSPKSGPPSEPRVAASTAPSSVQSPRETEPPVESPSKPSKAPKAAASPASNALLMHVEIEAREPSWVSVTDSSGKRLLAKTLDANETEQLDLESGATLRTGNAGGVVVRLNGKDIGAIGPAGKIRDISFKNGAYKIHTPDAG